MLVCVRKQTRNDVGKRRRDAHGTVNHKNQLHVGHDGFRCQPPHSVQNNPPRPGAPDYLKSTVCDLAMQRAHYLAWHASYEHAWSRKKKGCQPCDRRPSNPVGSERPLSAFASTSPPYAPTSVTFGDSTHADTINSCHAHSACSSDLCDHALRLLNRSQRRCLS